MAELRYVQCTVYVPRPASRPRGRRPTALIPSTTIIHAVSPHPTSLPPTPPTARIHRGGITPVGALTHPKPTSPTAYPYAPNTHNTAEDISPSTAITHPRPISHTVYSSPSRTRIPSVGISPVDILTHPRPISPTPYSSPLTVRIPGEDISPTTTFTHQRPVTPTLYSSPSRSRIPTIDITPSTAFPHAADETRSAVISPVTYLPLPDEYSHPTSANLVPPLPLPRRHHRSTTLTNTASIPRPTYLSPASPNFHSTTQLSPSSGHNLSTNLHPSTALSRPNHVSPSKCHSPVSYPCPSTADREEEEASMRLWAAGRYHGAPRGERRKQREGVEPRAGAAGATVARRGGARGRRERRARRACSLAIAGVSAVWAVAWFAITVRSLVKGEELPIAEAAAEVRVAVRPPREALLAARWLLAALHAVQLAAAAALARGSWKNSSQGVLQWLWAAGISLVGYGAGLLGLGVVADAASALALAATVAVGMACMQLVYSHFRLLRVDEIASVTPSSPPPPPPVSPPPPPPPPSPATDFRHQSPCKDCV